jgi:hypothetical protein
VGEGSLGEVLFAAQACCIMSAQILGCNSMLVAGLSTQSALHDMITDATTPSASYASAHHGNGAYLTVQTMNVEQTGTTRTARSSRSELGDESPAGIRMMLPVCVLRQMITL